MFRWRLCSSRPTALTHARKPQGEQRWHADPGPQMTPICPTGTLDGGCWWHDGWRGPGCGRGGFSCRQRRAVPEHRGLVLGGSRGGSSLPRGERLCTTARRARSQMVLLPRTAWVAFGQRHPSSSLTMTAIALMINSGSHMLLIIPSFAFS